MIAVHPGRLWGWWWLFLSCCLTALSHAQQSGDFNYSNDGASISIVGYTGAGGTIVIPDTIAGLPVTSIGIEAFGAQTALTGVTIPDSVIGIEHGAFAGCTSLTGIVIPDSVTSLGGAAFGGCTSLIDVTLGEGITAVEMSTFYNCLALARVTIGSRVTRIERWAFGYCPKLTHVTIPASVTRIMFEAFVASGLTDVIFMGDAPAIAFNSFLSFSPTRIYRFEGSAGFTAPTWQGHPTAMLIPSDAGAGSQQILSIAHDPGTFSLAISGKAGRAYQLHRLSDLAAGSWTALATLPPLEADRPVDMTDPAAPMDQGFYRVAAFEAIRLVSPIEGFHYLTDFTTVTITGYTGGGGEVFIPDSIGGLPVTEIDSGAFSNKTEPMRVTIPDSVTRLAAGAFEQNTGLTDVTLGEGLTAIEAGTFRDCTGLTGVTIPDQVNLIEAGAFQGCTALTSVIIPGHVKRIGYSAFQGCTGLTSVIVGNGVTHIGQHAFADCSGLTAVALPASVSDILGRAFTGCSGLLEIAVASDNPTFSCANGVLFDKNRTVLWEYPAGKVGDYTVPDGVLLVGTKAFAGCAGLSRVTVPDSVSGLATGAFADCTGLTRVTLGSGLVSIDSQAFLGCTSLQEIAVAAGNELFSSLDGVLFNKNRTTLLHYPGSKAGGYTIPDGVTRLEAHVFASCPVLTSVTLPDSLAEIGNDAFLDCPQLLDITVGPENPVYLSMAGVLFAKDGQTLLRYPGGKTGDYTVPNQVQKIGRMAFASCRGLTKVTLLYHVDWIEDRAFEGCTGLANASFLGDAPRMFGRDVFLSTAPSFAVYYLVGRGGFTAPRWKGYPTVPSHSL